MLPIGIEKGIQEEIPLVSPRRGETRGISSCIPFSIPIGSIVSYFVKPCLLKVSGCVYEEVVVTALLFTKTA